jgi:hypothetical protein
VSRHHDPLGRILNAYPPGLALLTALDTYIRTCEDTARSRARDEVASTVCEGLHAGPAQGLKCMACYQAEANAPYLMQVEAEIEREREERKRG